MNPQNQNSEENIIRIPQEDGDHFNASENYRKPDAPKGNLYLTPLAVLIAGAMITGGIIFTRSAPPSGTGGSDTQAKEDFGNNLSAAAANIKPITKSDHVRGSPKAPVTIIEFSDFQCPFCARFHPTIKKILEEYDEEVKWVYRHFPLSSIHPQAIPAALASECVASLAGNDAFWGFTDQIFEKEASSLNQSLYDSIAAQFGVNKNNLSACMNKKETADSVMEDLKDATDSGGRGTPYSIVINAKGDTFPFSGALPYEQVKGVMEQAINSK